MTKLPILNNKSDPEDFELTIWQSKVNLSERNIENLETHIKGHELFFKKICAIVSTKTGQSVTEGNIHSALINLPKKIQGDIYDEVYGKQDCLIKPSHSFLPYSLVGRQPELEEYIPPQNPKTGLEVLNDKSTSRAFEIIKEHTSENTYRAHMGDIVYIQAWLSAMGFGFDKPISDKELTTFIVQHAEGLDTEIDKKLVAQGYKARLGPHKLATIKRRIASLSVFVESVKWPNPCHTKKIKHLLNKLTKKYGSSRPAGKAITKDILDDMLDTCSNKLIDIRDTALLLFTWGSGGRRRSEVAAANMKDLTRTPAGEFVYKIPRSKTDQEGKGNIVPVKGRAARALNDWLTISAIKEGAIFRAIGKGGEMRGALSDVDLNRVVKKRLKKAGYDETQFGAHGLRSGFVTEAGRRNKPLGDVMALTTHRNVGTVMKYYQAGNISNNSAANLAD